MADITKNQLHELTATMKNVVGDDTKANDLMDSVIRLLSVPEDQFEILAPGIMQSYQQSLNNPNDKIALVQALNATGGKAEDVTEAFLTLSDEVDKTNLSKPKRDFLKEMLASIVNSINDTEGIAKRNVPVAIELCHPDAKIPQYAHISDSGMDVYALDDITVHPGETVLVPTGIKVALPVGFELQVRPKSGRALKTKLRVANTPGTIDQAYRDEIKVIIENVEPPIRDITTNTIMKENGFIDHMEITSIEYGKDFTIGKGEKFCQLVLCEVPKVAFYRVDNVQEIGNNRNGGFGSTGLK
jgi:dUTP pyrophosphatase